MEFTGEECDTFGKAAARESSSARISWLMQARRQERHMRRFGTHISLWLCLPWPQFWCHRQKHKLLTFFTISQADKMEHSFGMA